MKKDRLGFLAQEVQEVIPEAVTYEKDEDKYYLDYDAIIPVIVEAMKEQQATIQEHQTSIQEQQTTINDLTARIEKLEGNASNKKSAFVSSTQNITSPITTLQQNVPNPFNATTTISMNIPEAVSNAKLYLYNMQGIQIKQFNVQERGATSVTIEGNSLDAGMYLYTLIADGKEVDTKKMILTK